jgi:hypothetical protein
MTYTEFFMVVMVVGVLIAFASYFRRMANLAIVGGVIFVASLITLSMPTYAHGATINSVTGHEMLRIEMFKL